MLGKEVIENLISKANGVRKYCYTPYLDFRVGAALLSKNDKVYTGCNIQNAAFSPSICAERVAIFKAISEGEKEFKAIAVVGGKDDKITDFCPPCAVCRQVMSEFCDDNFEIILYNGSDYKIYKLVDLLPMAFSKSNL